MGYSLRIRIEDYVMVMLRNDSAKLPSRKPGCYSAWLSDFAGDEPASSNKDQIVYVGKTEKGADPQLLYRVTQFVLDAIGITGAGQLSGNKHSFFHIGGREVFLKHGNLRARQLLLTWRDDGICPSCEEHRIYQMFCGGKQLLNRKVRPCPNPNHP
jgi:hypothetical protein